MAQYVNNVIRLTSSRRTGIRELVQGHVAEVASSTCIHDSDSKHENVSYHAERTDGAPVNCTFTCLYLAPRVLERLTANKAPKNGG